MTDQEMAAMERNHNPLGVHAVLWHKLGAACRHVSRYCMLGFFFACLGGVLEAQTEERSAVKPDDVAFYMDHVKPILEAHCFECHANDPDDLQASFALTSRASIMRGGDTGAGVDFNSPEESLLLKVINYELYEMPPEGKLSADDIAILSKWVDRGLPFDPAEEKDLTAQTHSTVPQVNAESKEWWSFQKVQTPKAPEVERAEWPQNPIDQFVLSRLEAAGIEPAKQATRRVLIRRAYYDLTGLPPTPEQVSAFENDESPDAFQRLVDELLASPRYGEKWGRHWLDLVRYAESNSFERDGTKPFVWRYRDYVIESFNDDKPYDQFLREQLAGDEIENPTRPSIIATGYYRLGQWDDEPVDVLQAKFDDLDDIVATTSQAMLGLTVNCARCHDHKIDPIPQADYYRMVSFFENIRRFGVRSRESVESASIRILLGGEAHKNERELYQSKLDEVNEAIRAIVDLARPGFESVDHEDFQYEMNRIPILKKRVGKEITQEQLNQYDQLSKQRIRRIENPPGSIKVLCVKEKAKPDMESFVRIRGNPHVKGEPVRPGFLSVLSPPEASILVPENGVTTGRRLAFADWLVDSENPLTARVMVNRIWQYHFGRGIVRTSSDFGFQGSAPTHPQLLDWLASEFVKREWSIKEMHRVIMASKSYQMSNDYREDSFAKDPTNDLYWRFDLRRLTAEEIRDSILAVNGQLNRETMYGPSVFPVMPPEVLAGQSRPGENWGNSSDADRNRRSIYIHVKRSLRLPILETHDSAETDNSCPVRFITTQPTQALGMINSEFVNRQARLFANQIRDAVPGDSAAQVALVLGKVTQRSATPSEIQSGTELIQAWVDDSGLTADQALDVYCLMALNLNEFVYVD